MKDVPLGKVSPYPDQYAPGVLAGVARADARAALDIVPNGQPMPFFGVDIWNAWELSWLSPGGKPVVAVIEIEVPATSPNIVESKSLKLYLSSLAMSEFVSPDDVGRTVSRDLEAVVGAEVTVRISEGPTDGYPVSSLPGTLIDNLSADCPAYEVDPAYLKLASDDVVEDALHSHLLRSLCPVTGQPDFASVLVEYRGPRIDPAGLLRYLVSYRQHQDFHEACVERMFMEIRNRCRCESLTVYARYTRRGGIDINPFRSTREGRAENLRMWRQ